MTTTIKTTKLPHDSPVETLRKQLPQGTGEWPGYGQVYRNLADAADAMGQEPYKRCGELHVQTMAVMGTGHEETMKAQQMLLRSYGWIK